MNLYVEKLNEYLSNKILTSDTMDIHSIMEFLYNAYTEWNPIHTNTIKSHFQDLEPVFDILSLEHSDLLFRKVCELCGEYEKEAFLDGLYVGAKLTAELVSLDQEFRSQ